jgi:hypothetical protein
MKEDEVDVVGSTCGVKQKFTDYFGCETSGKEILEATWAYM